MTDSVSFKFLHQLIYIAFINLISICFYLQVDPLKFHTYGVKKPIEQKQENIQQLYNDQKRYYP